MLFSGTSPPVVVYYNDVPQLVPVDKCYCVRVLAPAWRERTRTSVRQAEWTVKPLAASRSVTDVAKRICLRYEWRGCTGVGKAVTPVVYSKVRGDLIFCVVPTL